MMNSISFWITFLTTLNFTELLTKKPIQKLETRLICRTKNRRMNKIYAKWRYEKQNEIHVNVYLLDTRMKGIQIMRNNLSNKQFFG